MSLTFTEAYDDMLTVVQTAWDTTGYLLLHENIAGKPPETEVPWARVFIRHAPVGGLSSLSNGTGKGRFERQGTMIVNIFVPVGDGLKGATDIAKIVGDALDVGKSANGVRFYDTVMNEIGPDGKWYQVNVQTSFLYTELK